MSSNEPPSIDGNSTGSEPDTGGGPAAQSEEFSDAERALSDSKAHVNRLYDEEVRRATDRSRDLALVAAKLAANFHADHPVRTAGVEALRVAATLTISDTKLRSDLRTLFPDRKPGPGSNLVWLALSVWDRDNIADAVSSLKVFLLHYKAGVVAEVHPDHPAIAIETLLNREVAALDRILETLQPDRDPKGYAAVAQEMAEARSAQREIGTWIRAKQMERAAATVEAVAEQAQAKLENIDRAQGRIADIEVSEHFKSFADTRRSAYRFWATIGVAALLGLIALSVYLLRDRPDSLELGEDLARLSISVPLFVLAFFAFRQAGHNRAIAEWAEMTHLKARTVDAYADRMTDSGRNMILLQFGASLYTVTTPPDFDSEGEGAPGQIVTAMVSRKQDASPRVSEDTKGDQ